MVRRALAFVLLAGIAVSSRAEEILVFAAASLTEPMQELGKTFSAKTRTSVVFSFGASSDLARQIAAGAPADVFFSADTAKMDDLEKKGFVRRADRREFLSNVLVVVVPATSGLQIRGAANLGELPRLALADPGSVPAGIYARKWLEGLGLWTRVEPKVVPTLDVRAALAAVETQAVPAAIVYRTDAAVSGKVRVAFEIRDGPQITYSLSRVAGSRSAAAERFVEYLTGEAGREVFERRGFRVQDPHERKR